MAKVHKLKGSTDIRDLPLRPVISNIGTSTYELSRYLATLLSPLAVSEYTISNSKDFIGKIKSQKIEQNYSMVSFDVTALFTNVPLDFTINLILDKIYKEKIIKTNLARKDLEKLLNLCTKEMHFSFNNQIYKQINGVAMGSPLGPVLANIFMVELEKKLVPNLADKMPLWFRYVDDTFTFIKNVDIENVKSVLNNFHSDIKFTNEIEKDNCI